MAKAKRMTAFFCRECGYESAKWMGQCPACRAWNSMVEEPVKQNTAAAAANKGITSAGTVYNMPVLLSEIPMDENKRTSSGYEELDRVLGGGIVDGSLILIGGDPGIGKSTLLLQVAANVSADGQQVLYVSGEESLQQLGIRASRLFGDKNAGTCSVRFLCETDLSRISELVLGTKPDMVVIDSIQTMVNGNVDSAPGSVSQVRETTAVLLKLAKETGTTIVSPSHSSGISP